MNRNVKITYFSSLWLAAALAAGLVSCQPPAPPTFVTGTFTPTVTATAAVTSTPTLTATMAPPSSLKEISYYPRDYAWLEFWTRWPEAKPGMDEDLDRIRALGFNTVRIFLHPDALGYPVPGSAAAAYFEEALTLIAAHGLRAHVNLFDCWQSWADIDGSRAWLAAVVAPHRDDGRVALWELRNEAGLDQDPIRSWVRALFPYLKEQAGGTPATVSVSDVEWLDDLRELAGPASPDIYSLHWYPRDPITWTGTFPGTVARARELIGEADLLIGEIGLSTYTYSDASQAALFNDFLYYAGREGIDDWGVWTLTDFPTGTAQCGGELPGNNGEWYFGLYRLDGSPKPAVSVLQSALQGSPPSGPSPFAVMDPSFEDLNPNSGQLDNWWPWDVDWTWQVWGAQDCTVARSGRCSVRLNGPGTMAVGLYNVPALPVEEGRLYSLEAFVRTENLSGRAWISISWFDAGNNWIGGTPGPDITGPDLTGWTRTSIEDAVAPPGAVHAQVFVQMESGLPDSYAWFDDVSVAAR